MDVVYCGAIAADAGQFALWYRSSRPAAHAHRRHCTKQSTDLLGQDDQSLIEHHEGLLVHWRARRVGWHGNGAVVGERGSDHEVVAVDRHDRPSARLP